MPWLRNLCNERDTLSAELAAHGVPYVFVVRTGGHGDTYTEAALRESPRFQLRASLSHGTVIPSVKEVARRS